MFEEMFQMRGQRDRFILPSRQTNQSTDAEPAKTGCVSAFSAIEPIIEIAFRPGGMHFRIYTAIVSFLINDEAFGAGLDNRHVILSVHRADLDRDRRKIGRKHPRAFAEIIATHKFGMLARNEQDLAKSLPRQMLRFGNDLIDIECDTQDGIIARETAILAIVDALV